MFPPFTQTTESSNLNTSHSIHEKIESLLNEMTLKEKIGQMTQINIGLINTSGKQKDVELDEKKLRSLLKKYPVGSFLNGEAVSAEKWFSFMKALTQICLEESRLKIPILYGIDHMHGASYLENSTLFPHNINLGATFNCELAHKAGKTTVSESADLGHHWIFAPVLDVARNPLWPRFYETYGEDPFLAGKMGAAFVQGIQESEEILPYKVAATAKHFIGYSDPKTGWDRTPAEISNQTLHEIYRPSFQMAVDAGLKSVMINSGQVNGVPVHASYELLTELLREQMGFQGVIVTDWADIDKLVDFHKVAENYKEAVFMSVMAGIDVSMTPDHFMFNDALLELVLENRIPESRLDESVRRVLALKFDLNLFEHPFPRNDRFSKIGSKKHQEIALETARESIVLLKNDSHILPLSNPKNIVLVGSSIRDKKNWHGGWTYTWQGASNERLSHTPSFEEMMIKEFMESNCTVFEELNSANTTSFEEVSQSADAIVVVVGEEPYTEFVGNSTDLHLSSEQETWIECAVASKKPVILVIVAGRPRLISSFNSKLSAVLFAGLPSTYGPQAVAEIISGKTNPSGKLSFSYPQYVNHFQPYNHRNSSVYFFDVNQANFIKKEVKSTNLYDFGAGESYTTFSYSNLNLSQNSFSLLDEIEIRVDLKNTGNRTGKESILWFITDEVGSISRPVLELKQFEKIELNPGESRTVHFKIHPQTHLSFPNSKGKPMVEKGSFIVRVGNQKASFTLV